MGDLRENLIIKCHPHTFLGLFEPIMNFVGAVVTASIDGQIDRLTKFPSYAFIIDIIFDY